MNASCCCSATSEDDTRPIDEGIERYANILLEFKGNRRAWFANPKLIHLSVGDWAVIEADRGEDSGKVIASRATLGCSHQLTEFRVLRAVTEVDLIRIERHHESEEAARITCINKIKTHKLQMKLVDVEYRLDEMKLTFYFTSEARVDFRELVRDLAGVFRTRIELRQIGARDELKRGDWFGICGLKLCCGNHLNSFIPITAGMAKSQHLILNPIKLSGRCGKLKCCLAFEMANYSDPETAPTRIDLPYMNDPDSKMEIISD